MTNISERAAYIRGLADGLGVDGKTPEQRVIREIITLLEETGGELSACRQHAAALSTHLKTLAADVEEIQNDLYEDYDETVDSPEALARTLGVIPSPAANPAPPAYLHCPNCGQVFPDPGPANPKPPCPHCGNAFLRG